jgi:hypothetical protein
MRRTLPIAAQNSVSPYHFTAIMFMILGLSASFSGVYVWFHGRDEWRHSAAIWKRVRIAGHGIGVFVYMPRLVLLVEVLAEG